MMNRGRLRNLTKVPELQSAKGGFQPRHSPAQHALYDPNQCWRMPSIVRGFLRRTCCSNCPESNPQTWPFLSSASSPLQTCWLASGWLVSSRTGLSRVPTFQHAHLEHRPDVVQVGGTRKRGFGVAHSLHQSLGCLSHLLHLQIVQQPSLLFTSYTYRERREWLWLTLTECLLSTRHCFRRFTRIRLWILPTASWACRKYYHLTDGKMRRRVVKTLAQACTASK